MTANIAGTPAWQALCRHAETLRPRHLREFFADDARRFADFSLSSADLLFDYSKQRLDRTALRLLVDLAEQSGVRAWIRRMFAGEKVNASEGRAALHVALRGRAASWPLADGSDPMPEIRAVQEAMRQLCEAVRSGALCGYSGEPIRAVVNIGIGGSDLGPRMATAALTAYAHPTLRVHFVSNVDGADLAPVLEQLDPRSTLFIVASKTFTTEETLTNAHSARNWLLDAAGELADAAMARQFVAVTGNAAGALMFGVAAPRLFAMPDWVGGRFSLWSAVGLPLALAIGMDAFDEMLAGAASIDQHFLDAPTEENLPLLMALLSIWNVNFLAIDKLSLAPYSQSLYWLPEYLQQLEMESNGKSRLADGTPCPFASAPFLIGSAGSNAQHAYFQLLHQGGRPVASDFIAFAASDLPLPGHHAKLLANALAQSEALAFGSAAADALRACPGNQPSSTLLLPRLDPYNLGRLIAIYEHKVCAQAAIWGINPFDQWGVELGKKLAARLLPALGSAEALNDLDADASTHGQIAWLNRQRQVI